MITSKTMMVILLVIGICLCQQQPVCQGNTGDFEVMSQYYLADQEFTEGYIYESEQQRIVESTGLFGQSVIRSYVLNDETNNVEDIRILYTNPNDQFGEGLSRVGNRYYQLTYRNGVINIFHENVDEENEENTSFELERTAAIPRDRTCQVPEGWGLTSDGVSLFMTDGSNRVFRIDPDALEDFDQEIFDTEYTETGCDENSHFAETFFVTDPASGVALENLNELELVGNFFYVNIWDPQNGSARIARLRLEGESIITTRIYDF
jgi:glutamine cyclotransferase